MIETKRCNKCEKDLPLIKFERTGAPGGQRRKRCFMCRKPDAIKRAVQRNNAKRRRLSQAEYDMMLKKQRGRCAICLCESTDMWKNSKRGLAVDHDHETGKIRALLCQRCNLGIGHFHDDVRPLERAINYLDVHR